MRVASSVVVMDRLDGLAVAPENDYEARFRCGGTNVRVRPRKPWPHRVVAA